MKPKSRILRFLLLGQVLLACIFLSASCGETNFVVTTDSVCRCSPEPGIEGPCSGNLQRWQHTVDNLFEVSARDYRFGELIGKECQGETSLAWDWPPVNFNSWRPVDGLKYNMAATLHHFNWNYDDDEDWNLHVVPTDDFQFLIDDVESLHGESVDDHQKCGGQRCMEAEISPDKQFWSNPWFFIPGARPEDTDDNGYSLLEGRQMGFYGPWIMDANHDFKSEIHPSEMMWFRDRFERGVSGSGPPLDIFWLLFLQDNTGRFDDRDNFDCDGAAPPGWRPWSDAPRYGEFNIAFEVNPATETMNFFVEELFSRFVITSGDTNAKRDADDGASHGLEYNGRVVVRVEETQPNDDDLGVTFTNLCLNPDGKLRGFVTIRSKIGGDDDKDEEGFHILYVARTRSTRPDRPSPLPGDLPNVLATAEQLEGSLRGNGDYFLGDLRLTLQGNKTTTDRDLRIARIDFAANDSRQELKFLQKKDAREVLVHDLPLVSGARLTITTASGLKLRMATPSLAPLPNIQSSITRSVVDNDAGRFLSAAVGGVRGASLPPGKQLSALQEVQLKLNPRYAAYKRSGSLTDVPSTFSRGLNQVIAENQEQKLQQLFKSSRPFTVAWTFEAVNLVTGNPHPVSSDNQPAAAGGVQVEVSSGAVANDTLKVKFPSPATDGIIELRAKATVTDTTGKTTTVERRAWSHGFQSTGNNINDWAQLIQTLAGVNDTSALLPPALRKPPVFNLVPDPKVRRAHILNSYLRETVRDKQITIEELTRLVRTLKKFAVA